MRLTSKMHAIGTLGISLLSVLMTVMGGKAPREGRAAALARTVEEAAGAAELLTLIEHDADHPAAELAQARRLTHLRPRDVSARLLLHRAEQCQTGLFAGGKSKASTRRTRRD